MEHYLFKTSIDAYVQLQLVESLQQNFKTLVAFDYQFFLIDQWLTFILPVGTLLMGQKTQFARSVTNYPFWWLIREVKSII